MTTRTVLFDLGDVLVRFSHDRMCRQIGELCGRSGSDTRELLIDSGLQWDFERGRLDETAFRDRLASLTDRTIDLDELRRASGDIFVPQPGMEEIVAALDEAGLRLVMLSNTCVTHIDWIRDRHPLFGRFDEYVLSYEVGTLKPEPAIYEAALAEIDCEPAECLYVDDRAENIEGAQPFGLDAVLFTDVPSLRDELVRRGLPTAHENEDLARGA